MQSWSILFKDRWLFYALGTHTPYTSRVKMETKYPHFTQSVQSVYTESVKQWFSFIENSAR